MMDNIFVRTDPLGNIKPDKEKSTEKIGSAVATIMALDRAIRNGGNTDTGVYDERGILVLYHYWFRNMLNWYKYRKAYYEEVSS